MTKTKLYKQKDGAGKGKIVEIMSENEKGIMILRNVRSGFKFCISYRNFNNHYIEVQRK